MADNTITKSKAGISVVILAKNEAARVSRAITSVNHWADEVILIDNSSTDETVNLAAKLGAKIITSGEDDFSSLRNLGLQAAAGMWLFYVDADESVTPELRQEIDGKINSFAEATSPVAYFIQRQNYYLGHRWPGTDRMQRLFWKPALKYWAGALHETAVVSGKMGVLDQPLIHNSHRTLEEMLDKTNVWSEVEARLRLQVNHPPVVPWRLFRVMWSGFYKSYIRDRGWRMGTIGIIESVYQAFSMFITYAKLWELQEKKIENEI